MSKTQIQNIVKDREDIKKRWEAGEHKEKKYVKVRKVGYDELDEVVWKWFTRARAKNIPVSGRLIQERAVMYAEEIGLDGFLMDGYKSGRSVTMCECPFCQEKQQMSTQLW